MYVAVWGGGELSVLGYSFLRSGTVADLQGSVASLEVAPSAPFSLTSFSE